MNTLSVNLMPADRVNDSRTRRRARAWSMVCVVHCIALLTAFTAWAEPGANLEPLRAELQEVLKNAEKRSAELDSVNREIATMRRQLDSARAVGHHPNWSNLVGVLVRSSSDDILLSKLSVQPDAKVDLKADAVREKSKGGPEETAGPQRYNVKMTGFANSQRTLGDFVGKLEGLDLFERITIEETRSQEVNGVEWTAFSVAAVLPDAPGTGGTGKESK